MGKTALAPHFLSNLQLDIFLQCATFCARCANSELPMSLIHKAENSSCETINYEGNELRIRYSPSKV
jgi:hypothetical protein